MTTQHDDAETRDVTYFIVGCLLGIILLIVASMIVKLLGWPLGLL